MVGQARLGAAEVLHREGNAAERAAGERRVLGALEGPLEGGVDEGAEDGIARLVAADSGLDELRGRELAARHQLRLRGGVEIQEGVGHVAPRCCAAGRRRSTVPKPAGLCAGLAFGPGPGSNSAVRFDGAIDRLGPRSLRAMLRRLGEPPIRFELFGEHTIGGGAAPLATVRVRDRGALARLLLDPDFQFGELYVAGRIEVEGDLIGALRLAFSVARPAGFAGRALDALRSRLPHDRGSASHSAHHHYDVGNEFYQLWLDQRMVYTCGYFPSPEDGLEEAQLAKLDHVCRKLALQPGERVIEAGCGWGALALHMARYYGVRVRAFNVAEAQLRLARELAEKEGLADRVEFVLDDYRSIRGRCDAFVSVGMLEHVGRECYRELGAVVGRVLEPGGRGLIHSIGRSRAQRLSRWTERRVFPGAYPPTLREMMEIFEPNGLAVLDVENLRRHYALTVRHWLRALRGRAPAHRRAGRPGARAHLRALSGGHRRELRGLDDRALPAGVHADRQRCDSLDARPRLHGRARAFRRQRLGGRRRWTAVTSSSSAAAPRARPAPSPSGAAASTWWWPTVASSLATRPAPAG